MIRDKVEKVAASGANVVICQKGIDDMSQQFLADNGVLAQWPSCFIWQCVIPLQFEITSRIIDFS
jgi:hypothetical protein